MLPLEFCRCGQLLFQVVSLQLTMADAGSGPVDEHSWGDTRPAVDPWTSTLLPLDVRLQSQASRPGASSAVIRVALPVLMDCLEEMRLKSRSELAAMMAQSVAEGQYYAFDPEPAVELLFDAAWHDLLRLQEAPAALEAWDFHAVVNSLFAEPPHSEMGIARGEWFVRARR